MFFFVIVFFCLKLSVDLVLQNCNILVPCATNRAEITRVWRSLGCSLITVSSFSLSLNSPESCCGGCTSLLTPLFTLQNFILNSSTQPKLSNSLKIKHLMKLWVGITLELMVNGSTKRFSFPHFFFFLQGKKIIHYYLDKSPSLNIWCDVTDTNQPIALVNVILCADRLMAVHTADIKITHPTLCNATWLCLDA